MPAFPELPWAVLVDQSPEALILVETGGRLVFANREARRMFGYENEPLAGVFLEALIPPEFRAVHERHRRGYLVRPTLRDMRSRGVPLFGLRRNGTRFPAEIRLSPIDTPDGLLTAATVYDATEHQLIATTLGTARDVANEANEGKSRFLAAVSHDLRQPLQTLRLLNAAMQHHVLAPEVEDTLREEQRALDAVSALVDKVLNVSKLESGTVEPEFASVPIATLLDDVRAAFEEVAREKRLKFEVKSCDQHVRADKTLLRQLLDNLISNAIKYTDTGYVRLSAVENANDRVTVTVEDSGIGIPATALHRIFDDFCQIDRPGRSAPGGLGLGLGTVRRIAALLQLEVQVRSTVDVGTRFWLDLPRSAAPVRIATSPPVRAKPADQRVFLIEDDAAIRKAMTLLLKVEGYRVEAVASLAEVAARLSTMAEPPTVVISDFHLAAGELGTDGIRLVRGKFNSPVPAVILTGDTSAATLGLTDMGRMVFLNKPVAIETLTDAIDHACATIEDPVRAGHASADPLPGMV
jgi:PAS domain S-box-containing protein